MITRRHQQGATSATAQFSACGAYRYGLTRVWAAGPRLLFVMLNPSTADEVRNDPTIARCETRARTAGFAGFGVVNLFAFRATDPRALRLADDPVGPENDRIIRRAAAKAGFVVCAWGNHGALNARALAVRHILSGCGKTLHHLGLTRSGQPVHPLYIPLAQGPIRWDQAAISAMSATSIPAPPVTTPIA
jgi:hypothetical protein